MLDQTGLSCRTQEPTPRRSVGGVQEGLTCPRDAFSSDERFDRVDGPGAANGVSLLRAAAEARTTPNYPCLARPASPEHEPTRGRRIRTLTSSVELSLRPGPGSPARSDGDRADQQPCQPELSTVRTRADRGAAAATGASITTKVGDIEIGSRAHVEGVLAI